MKVIGHCSVELSWEDISLLVPCQRAMTKEQMSASVTWSLLLGVLGPGGCVCHLGGTEESAEAEILQLLRATSHQFCRCLAHRSKRLPASDASAQCFMTEEEAGHCHISGTCISWDAWKCTCAQIELLSDTAMRSPSSSSGQLIAPYMTRCKWTLPANLWLWYIDSYSPKACVLAATTYTISSWWSLAMLSSAQKFTGMPANLFLNIFFFFDMDRKKSPGSRLGKTGERG